MNESGIKPVGVSILVMPEQVEETSESGIILHTSSELDRQQMRQTDAVVVELGDSAYYDEPSRCKVGDRVVIAAYAGFIRKGKDGKNYRLIKDDDVKAIILE